VHGTPEAFYPAGERFGQQRDDAGHAGQATRLKSTRSGSLTVRDASRISIDTI
jgi:hypothetical protein